MITQQSSSDMISNDFMSLMKNGTVKKKTWEKIENHKIYARWLGESLGYKTMDDWYQLTKRLIEDNRGRGLLQSKYSNSPIMFLKGVFPEVEWLPWKLGNIKGYWNDIENQKIYAKWLGETLGYKNMDDWYQLTNRLIGDNYGCGLLDSKYSSSPLMFLKGVFPEVEWLPWKLGVPNSYWNDIENHKTYAKWLAETLGYKNMDDWYQITQALIKDNYGCGLLHKYSDSPLMFLKGVFPDVEWLPWKFGLTTRDYWDNIENHKIYANWLGERLGYKNMDDWYQITKKLIIKNHGDGLLGNKYGDSPLMFLKGVFPGVDWLPWKFGNTTRDYWNNIENHKIYAKWLAETLGYKNMDDWYKITATLIKDNYGCGLLDKYKSAKLFVMSVYPEYPWVSSKFVKNYSQGQIEWLNYMILSIPDIIHAINNSNGEYSIPNSSYHADGYSESKKNDFGISRRFLSW